MFFADGYCNDEHDKNCLEVLYNMYKTKRFVDASFHVGAERFDVHKIILAASSEFFMERFNETDTEYDFVELANCDEIAMTSIIRYCYTGKIDFDEENITNVLNTADLLKMPALVAGITKGSE